MSHNQVVTGSSPGGPTNNDKGFRNETLFYFSRSDTTPTQNWIKFFILRFVTKPIAIRSSSEIKIYIC